MLTENRFGLILQPSGTVGLACLSPSVPSWLDSRSTWKRFCLRSLVPL
jgi:hypothetical protein